MKLFKRLWHANTSFFAVVQTGFVNVAIQCLNIASGVITARTLAPGGRGALSAITMWPNFFAFVLTLGTPLSFIYYIKKRPDLATKLSAAAITLSLVSGLIGSVIGYFVIPHSLRTYSAADIHLAQKMVFLAPLGLLAVTLTAQVQSSGSYRVFNFFRFVSPFSILVGLVVLRLSGYLNPRNAAFVYLLAGIPALGWLIYRVFRTMHPSFTGMTTAGKLLLSYGVRAWGADILGTIANQVDRILIVGLLPPASMGLYVVAQSAAGVMAVIPNAIASVILPRVAGKSVREIVDVTGAAFRFNLLIMGAAGLPLFLFGSFLLRLVYGNKFSGAAAILPFLIIEAILDGLAQVLSQAFIAAGMPGMLTFLQGLGVLTAVPLIYLLIPRFGVRGAATALMLATFCRLAFVLFNFPFRLKVKPPKFLLTWNEVTTLIRTRQMLPTQDT